jgi:uncharacterized membrane protein
MPAQQSIAVLVTFLHNLSTVVWIGGLITLGIVVLPSARKVLAGGSQTKELMDAIQRRLSVLIYVSIAVLIVTGVLMTNRSPAYEGFLAFSNNYSTALSLKHILVSMMIAVTVARSLAVDRWGVLSNESREKLKAGLLYLNISLGVTVVMLSSIAATLSTGRPPG